MSNGYTFPAKPIRGKKTRRRKFQERRARRESYTSLTKEMMLDAFETARQHFIKGSEEWGGAA